MDIEFSINFTVPLHEKEAPEKPMGIARTILIYAPNTGIIGIDAFYSDDRMGPKAFSGLEKAIFETDISGEE